MHRRISNMHSKTRFLLTLFALSCAAASAQVSLFSVEEPYLRALELEGTVERPFLNYRTLEDERWDTDALTSEWTGFPLARTIRSGELSLELYAPDTFLSYNTAYPHGMNDGALWQGVGANATTSAGFRAAGYGFSATLKPEVHYSQNADFDIMPSAYPSEYGYFWAIGMDVYQRPGDGSVYDWSWGDSEIRYSWKAATIGFGTQAVWLGPGVNNAIILSNNAAPFPKLDFGVRKTRISYIGEVEARAFWGQLSESEWFDENPDNDNNLIQGMALSWSPAFFPEFTLGVNRIILTKWEDFSWTDATSIFIPDLDTGYDAGDQRISTTGELLFTTVGLRIWGEIAWNDFYRSWDSFIRYPFHTVAYAAGLEKVWRLPSPRYAIMFQGEVSSTESSRDTAVYWTQTFYAHHIVTQGHTNGGQYLGVGYGSGGNFQRGSLSLLHPDGSASFFVQRLNRNSDYIYFLNAYSGLGAQTSAGDRWKQNAEFSIGIDTSWILTRIGIASVGVGYNMNHNPLYNNDGIASTILNSVYLSAGLKLSL
jgi:hypothetical protein